MSQPAVSQAIKQLERQLGVPLFVRRHSGVELSAQGGKPIFSDIETALKLLSDAESKLSQLSKSASGTLRIGASETIFRYVLSNVIVEYSKRFPEVKIDLTSDISPKVIEALKADRCDIGFLNLPIAHNDEIDIVDTVALLNDVFIAGERFGELKGKSIPVRELSQFPLLLMREHTAARDSFDNYLDNHGVTLKATVEVDSWALMKRLVEGGMGIGCIPREYALLKLKDGALFELDVKPTMPTRSVGMALAKNANVPYSVCAFMEMLKPLRR